MKSYLLLGISVLLLLFTLPKPPQAVSRWESPETSVLKKACTHQKYSTKRICKKKCLRRQTHSGPENKSGTVTDCGTHIFALAAALLQMPAHHFFPEAKAKAGAIAVAYLPPPLERDPNPPRFS
ncbi:hypothetical protein GU926_05605 [Nibribacter ruber]|uniref:Uncharacterized protein n=1 Tax=Nibribacter ruber TaxID=2698458 RepID=A0A6P1NXM2_9BACT|nr:hypothetical protein [Nibribacter ruber]QHL86939.1 hypothetical protein GU926_05605 [Nibribacter ruber]